MLEKNHFQSHQKVDHHSVILVLMLRCWFLPLHFRCKVDNAVLAPYFSLGGCMEGLSHLFSSLYGVTLQHEDTQYGEVWSHDGVCKLVSQTIVRFLQNLPCRVGLVVSMSASHTVGHWFASYQRPS